MEKISLNLTYEYIVQQANKFGLIPEKLDSLNLELSEIDNMYEKWKEYCDEHYFNVGLQALSIIENTRRTLLKDKYDSILDFGCGFGRVLRFLKAYYPESHITLSELFPEYVEFCSKTFDLDSFQSITNFSALPTDKKYDLIWSGSVFTHLPSNKFDELLKYFEDSLSVGGVMVFTTHGRFCWENLSSHAYGLDKFGKRKTQIMYKLLGFGYSNYPTMTGYGVSIMTLKWFANYISKKDNLKLIAIHEKCWDNHQDVMIIQKIK
jgi:SAM-dependent methyltransferase